MIYIGILSFLISCIFSIGVSMMISSKEIICSMVALEVMKLASILFISISSYYSGYQDGIILIFIILIVGAAEMATGLSILSKFHKQNDSIFIKDMKTMRL